MRPTRQLMWATVACASLVLVSCGGEDGSAGSVSGAASSADYVEAVEDVLSPAAALASIAADRLGGEAGSSRGAAGLVLSAEDELGELRSLRLTDSRVVAQRARLVRAFGPVLARMRVVARHLVANDLPGLRRSGPRLFEVIKELPSATSA
jgi:hypothetical protein